MKKEKKPAYQQSQENLSKLSEIQEDLEKLFTLLDIDYKAQLTFIKNPSLESISTHSEKLNQSFHSILERTEQILSKKHFTDYMEFGEITTVTISILKSLIGLLQSINPQFYKDCHRLLKYYWGIRFVIARFELEIIPEFCENFIAFFNLPDDLFEFIQKLKGGPLSVQILAEMDLKLRVDTRLPILLSRTPDHISLSPLGEKLLTAHGISSYYYFYLYEFEEEVLDTG